MAAPVNIQVPCKAWELSRYELQRTPQEVLVDATEVAVSPRSLHSELMCPICLDMLRKTMTTKECMHRFCSDCIITALRSGNKECPTCRKKLVSKRSLRHDPNFDALISQIYPNRDEYEAHQRRALDRFRELHNPQPLILSMEEGIRLQAQYRPLRARKPHQDDGDNTTSSGDEENVDTRSHASHESAHSHHTSLLTNQNTEAGPSQAKRPRVCNPEADGERSQAPRKRRRAGSKLEIELVFHPHPLLAYADQHSQTRYVKTTANATVDHLSRYLALRIALEGHHKEGPSGETRVEETAEEAAVAEGNRDGGSDPQQDASEKQYTIFITTGSGQFSTLNGSLTLELVNEKYWKMNKPLELYYAPTQGPAAETDATEQSSSQL